ncbi:MAG: hypothetical protein HRU43_07735 [Simkaniaceae bacterium]|nr:hypothetical protein [Simkaniaceae bacterium]
MARMNDVLKRWADFSDSETKPLFWMLLGPLLMMLTITLSAPFISNPFLPLIAVSGLVFSWRYKVGGFALTLLGLVMYFALSYLFGYKDVFIWKLGWGLSLVLGLTISFLSMEELKSYYAKMKEGKENALNDLQVSLHSFEEKVAMEKRVLDQEIETLKEELSSSREEVEALLSLIEASRIEAEKVYKQSDALTLETLENHRELESINLKFKASETALSTLEKEHRDAQGALKDRLKKLNTYRVELYQARLLSETYQKQLKKAREYFLAQKKSAPQEKRDEIKSKSQTLILETLEKDKGMIKKIYDEILQDYTNVKKALEDGSAQLEKAPDDALAQEVAKLAQGVKERKEKLEKTKSELIGIEREIFITKKGLQQQGQVV